MVGRLTTENFKDVIQEDGVLVKFKTDHCIPCKISAPIFEKLSEANPQYAFYEMDAEDEYQITSDYSVLSVPTVILFRKGEEVMRMDGMKLTDTTIKEVLG